MKLWITQISNFIKIRPVEAKMFHVERRANRHDETNSRFRNFAKAPKSAVTCRTYTISCMLCCVQSATRSYYSENVYVVFWLKFCFIDSLTPPHTLTLTHTKTLTRTLTHSLTHSRIRSHTHTLARSLTHTHLHTCKHTHTQTHTRTHTHSHIH